MVCFVRTLRVHLLNFKTFIDNKKGVVSCCNAQSCNVQPYAYFCVYNTVAGGSMARWQWRFQDVLTGGLGWPFVRWVPSITDMIPYYNKNTAREKAGFEHGNT